LETPVHDVRPAENGISTSVGSASPNPDRVDRTTAVEGVVDGCVVEVSTPGPVVTVVPGTDVKRSRAYWDHSAPAVWPPPLTYGETRRIAEAELPGVRYGRHLLFRYSLCWNKPAL